MLVSTSTPWLIDWFSTNQSARRQICKHCSLQMHCPRCRSLELQRQWAGLKVWRRRVHSVSHWSPSLTSKLRVVRVNRPETMIKGERLCLTWQRRDNSDSYGTAWICISNLPDLFHCVRTWWCLEVNVWVCMRETETERQREIEGERRVFFISM